MKTRLTFLGMSVFFAMVAFLGVAFLASGKSRYIRFWLMALSGAAFAVLSLIGVFFPKKMNWLLVLCKPQNKE